MAGECEHALGLFRISVKFVVIIMIMYDTLLNGFSAAVGIARELQGKFGGRILHTPIQYRIQRSASLRSLGVISR